MIPFCIKLSLDPALPLMAWEDECIVYPKDYVHSAKGRKLAATENRIQRLVQKAVSEVCANAVRSESVEDYLGVRDLVIAKLCCDDGFIVVPSARHVILREDLRSSKAPDEDSG